MLKLSFEANEITTILINLLSIHNIGLKTNMESSKLGSKDPRSNFFKLKTWSFWGRFGHTE